MPHTTTPAFPKTHRASIEALRAALTTRISCRVSVESGTTDCGQQWAALVVRRLPKGSCGRPGPLVSFVSGNGVPGVAAVMAADGSTLVTATDEAGLDMAFQIAQDAGALEYAEMTAGGALAH